MSCCGSKFCTGAQQMFGARVAEDDLKSYRRKGPKPTTRLLRDQIVAAGGGGTLLDIGGGIGALSYELLARGFERTTIVDASSAYQAVAKRAAAEGGLEPRAEFREGDFVDHAPQIPPADVVMLDRVVCCYPEYRPLLEAAAARSRRVFAYAYPRERWAARLALGVENLIQKLTRTAFRAFVHPEAAMRAILERHGFRRMSRRTTFLWSADVYVREPR